MSRKRSGREPLLELLKARTQGYPNVQIIDFTNSWTDGLAFCAVLHSYCPDLIDYSNLKPDAKLHNLALAFTIAEKIGIPKLMEPQDLLSESGPDKFRIITYLSEFMCLFRSAPVSSPASPGAPPSPPFTVVKQFEVKEESKRQEEEHKKRVKKHVTKCTGTDMVRAGLVTKRLTEFELKSGTSSTYQTNDPFIMETLRVLQVPTGLVAGRISNFLKIQEKRPLDVDFIVITSPRTKRRNVCLNRELSNIFYVMKAEDKGVPAK